jgi:antirestriction protein ArdC
MDNVQIYKKVVDVILGQLEKGVIPWRKGWKCYGSDSAMPINLLTKKAYRGVNVITLGMCSPFSSNKWGTFKQIKKAGGHVLRGSKGYPVVFWSPVESKTQKNEDGNPRKYFLLKYSVVFNVEQTSLGEAELKAIEAAKADEQDDDFEPIDVCEEIVNGFDGPSIANDGGNRAFYWVTDDGVHMPPKSRFESEEEYYGTLFHELAHSTGHSSRLDRKVGCAAFGSQVYSREELIAEFSAAMICGVAGIDNVTVENSAAYIAGWSRKLKGDPECLVKAASAAEKAANLILGL